jgi:hypothetical protein
MFKKAKVGSVVAFVLTWRDGRVVGGTGGADERTVWREINWVRGIDGPERILSRGAVGAILPKREKSAHYFQDTTDEVAANWKEACGANGASSPAHTDAVL